jgi:four helix bundle protein
MTSGDKHDEKHRKGLGAIRSDQCRQSNGREVNDGQTNRGTTQRMQLSSDRFDRNRGDGTEINLSRTDKRQRRDGSFDSDPIHVKGSLSEVRASLSKSKRPVDIVQRTAEFADRIIQVALAVPPGAVGWEVARQLVRAGMSVGANVEEAQAAESKADFVHKMKIARKECRETRYFLKRLANAELILQVRLRGVENEAEQLTRIMTAIIRNAGG